MNLKVKISAISVTLIITFLFYVISCTHKDELVPSGGGGGGPITRGDQHVDNAAGFDKAHSNVNWSTKYLGSVSALTGRFNTFHITRFKFWEENPDSIYFTADVWLNSVNTSEPARDGGCLLATFGTAAGAGAVDSNMAVIKSKKVVFSTTDKGYIVTADFTFHKVTKEITAKLSYDGKAEQGTQDTYGFSLDFSILALSDFGIVSTSIGDNVDIICNAAIKF
ncbi:YceI family protein [Pinibacter aurantiacus]|uniref:YceI family protein n=1 Tax=Pinibacter aurantiacus TaxID=2851599 RepID=A0A9E2SC85_9BACT|nr:YceI family protein [Pinibacter aurantiacus]MBV4357235.1 YceI family protein [Pinibacter aurantiacus]